MVFATNSHAALLSHDWSPLITLCCLFIGLFKKAMWPLAFFPVHKVTVMSCKAYTWVFQSHFWGARLLCVIEGFLVLNRRLSSQSVLPSSVVRHVIALHFHCFSFVFPSSPCLCFPRVLTEGASWVACVSGHHLVDHCCHLWRTQVLYEKSLTAFVV